VIASKTGLAEFAAKHPDVLVSVGAVDEIRDGSLYPGLGDSGDRLFATLEYDDEDLQLPSKRRRSID